MDKLDLHKSDEFTIWQKKVKMLLSITGVFDQSIKELDTIGYWPEDVMMESINNEGGPSGHESAKWPQTEMGLEFLQLPHDGRVHDWPDGGWKGITW